MERNFDEGSVGEPSQPPDATSMHGPEVGRAAMVIFGKTLKNALNSVAGLGVRCGVRQADLALFLEVHPSNVTKWIGGTVLPASENIAGIARFFSTQKLYPSEHEYCSVAFWTIRAHPEIFQVLCSDPSAWIRWGQWTGPTNGTPVSPKLAEARVQAAFSCGILEDAANLDPEVAETLGRIEKRIGALEQRQAQFECLDVLASWREPNYQCDTYSPSLMPDPVHDSQLHEDTKVITETPEAAPISPNTRTAQTSRTAKTARTSQKRLTTHSLHD